MDNTTTTTVRVPWGKIWNSPVDTTDLAVGLNVKWVPVDPGTHDAALLVTGTRDDLLTYLGRVEQNDDDVALAEWYGLTE